MKTLFHLDVMKLITIISVFSLFIIANCNDDNKGSSGQSSIQVNQSITSYTTPINNFQQVLLLKVTKQQNNNNEQNKFLSLTLNLAALDQWQSSSINVYKSNDKHVITCGNSKSLGHQINACFIPSNIIDNGQVLKLYIKTQQSSSFAFHSQFISIKSILPDQIQTLTFSQISIPSIYLLQLSYPSDTHFSDLTIKLFPDAATLSSKSNITMLASYNGKIPTQNSFDLQAVQEVRQVIYNSQTVNESIKYLQINSSLISKANPIYLSIYGISNTPYFLSYKVNLKPHKHLKSQQVLYDTLSNQTSKKYYFQLPDLKDLNQQDYFIVKISVLFGQIKYKFYNGQKQQQQNLLEASKSYAYMGDTELIFPIKQLKLLQIKQINGVITTNKNKANFLIYFQKKSFIEASQIKDGVYQFIQTSGNRTIFYDTTAIVNGIQKQYIFQNASSFLTEKTNKQQIKGISFLIQKIDKLGLVKLDFFICESFNADQQCLIQKNHQKRKLANEIIQSSFGKKHFYTVNLKIPFNQNSFQLNGLSSVLKTYFIIQLHGVKQEPHINNNQDNKALSKEKQNLSNLSTISLIKIKNKNKIEQLMIGKITDNHLQQQQRKIFSFNPNLTKTQDQTLLQLIFLVNIVSGKISYFTASKFTSNFQNNKSFQDPSQTYLTSSHIKIKFKQNLDKPVFISIQALQQTEFTLTIRTVTKNKQENQQITPFVINEDIDYTIVIPSMEIQIIQMHPLFKMVNFKWDATGAITVCSLKNLFKNCQSQTIKEINKKGVLFLNQNSVNNRISQNIDKILDLKQHKEKNQSKIEVEYLKLYNPDPSRSISVNIRFHSGPEKACIVSRVNKMNTRTVANGKCFSFHLNRQQDLRIVFALNQMGHLILRGLLCEQNVQFLNQQNGQFIIKKQVIKEKCLKYNESNHKRPKSLVISASTKQKIDQNIKVTYLVQYADEQLTILPEGIAFNQRVLTKYPKVRTFSYQLINLINTNVIANVRQGSIKMYAKIIPLGTFNKSNLILNEDDYDFSSSQNHYFHKNPIIKITKQQIHNKTNLCQKTSCQIIISVITDQKLSNYLQYSIQVVQNSIHLKDHQPFPTFIPKNSITYFQYQSKKDNQTIVITISDYNQDCTVLYFGQEQFPGKQRSLFMESGPQLIFPAHKKNYYIGLQAINKDCPLSISISATQFKLQNLVFGNPALVKLKEKQHQYFFFKHNNLKQFKIITIQKYGQLKIYLNQSSNQTLNSLIMKKQLPLEHFKVSSQFMNSLIISPNDTQFCSNCNYVVGIQGVTNTQGSIILVDQESPLKLLDGKILYDIIEGKQKSFIDFYDILKGKICINMYKGNVKVTVKYKKKQQEFLFSQNQALISKKNKQQKQSPQQSSTHNCKQFDLQSDQILYYDWTPIKLLVQNHQKTKAVYSLKIISEKVQHIEQIKSGFPNYIYLQENQTKCLAGHIINPMEKIFIQTDKPYQPLLSSLKIQTLIGKNTKSSDQKILIVDNIIQLTFNLINYEFQPGIQYKICFSTGDKVSSIPLTILQASRIMLIPDGKDFLISGRYSSDHPLGQEFMFNTNGGFILDIFDCGIDQHGASVEQLSGVKYLYSSNYEQIQKIDLNNNQTLKELQEQVSQNSFADQPHAIYIQNYGNVFLKVFPGSVIHNEKKNQIHNSKSIIRWIEVMKEHEIGMGYHYYRKGEVGYQSSINSIIFNWHPVRPIIQTKTKIVQQIYTIFISDTISKVRSAANCKTKSGVNFYTKAVTNNQIKKNDMFEQKILTGQINKKDLISQFQNFDRSKNLYVLIVGDIVIQPPGVNYTIPGTNQTFLLKKSENYKFLYSQMEIASEIVLDSKLQITKYILLAVIVIIGVPGLLYCGYFFVDRIAPVISRLKTQAMVEENEIQKSKQNQKSQKKNGDQIKIDDKIQKNQNDFQMPVGTDVRMIKS